MIPVSILLGKAVRAAARFKGGGSALPGLVVERFDPKFMGEMLAKLPRGVVVISGTNGKTTTTKMVVELLRAQGLRVFTNRSGSNFTRGVVASLVSEASVLGRLDADIAVLELDEAHAVHFVKAFAPDYALLLNVLRDQLDRFGEIDTTAGFLNTIAEHTSGTVVLNREDPRVAAIAGLGAAVSGAQVRYFGLSPQLRALFPNDDDMHSGAGVSSAEALEASVVLEQVEGSHAVFSLSPAGPGAGEGAAVQARSLEADLALKGVYNVFNAAAALALVQEVMGARFDAEKAARALSAVQPAFGRGEAVMVNGQELELVLVKNPSGFRLALTSFDSVDRAVMIAINDNYADGRDMSWLWDVDFASLRGTGVDRVSGVRAADMALRLKYDGVPVGEVREDLASSLDRLIEQNPGKPKRIFCTYTAMLALRKELERYTTMEDFS